MYRSSLKPAPSADPPVRAARRRRQRFGLTAAALAVALVAVTFSVRISSSGRARGADLDQLPWPDAGSAAMLVDGHLYEGPNADSAVPIASVAKVMTAYVVLRDHPLHDGAAGPTITVTAAEAAAYPAQRAAGESLVPVTAGERLTERQALEALLLPSADNVAWILARWDAGSQLAFVRRMDAAAHRLGLHQTAYTDASGLAASTVSSAQDQVRLAAAAMRIDTLAAIVAEPAATLPVAGVVHNYNTLLGEHGVIGLKTGSTSAAGGCLLFAARGPGGGLVVGAVLGQQGKGLAMVTAALDASRRLVVAAG